MNLPLILEGIATLALSSYFVILTFSFFKFRLEQKKEELHTLTEQLDLGSISLDVHKSFDKEFSRIDYLLPVTFVTILTFLGLFLLLLSPILYDIIEGTVVKSALWSGSDFWNDPVYGQEKRSIAIVAWALLGGYLNGAQYIYRRFATVDLTPGNFYSLGIRMVLATVVSLMLSYVLPDDGAFSPNLILILAFLTGMFPERGLKVLMSRVEKFFPAKGSAEAENIPLEAIEGISYFHKLRLTEVGIDNVQNLANYDFLLLVIKTPFPIRILLDWVSQAKLMTEFREDTASLHKAGIRSALDLLDALKANPGRIDEVARLTGLEKLLLEINLKNLEKDRSLWLIGKFREQMEYVDKKD